MQEGQLKWLYHYIVTKEANDNDKDEEEGEETEVLSQTHLFGNLGHMLVNLYMILFCYSIL